MLSDDKVEGFDTLTPADFHHTEAPSGNEDIHEYSNTIGDKTSKGT